MTGHSTGVELDAIKGWVEALRKLQHDKRDIEEQIAAARAKIEDALGEADTGTVGGVPVVRWTHVTSRRFDQTLAKAKLPADLLAACYTETTSRRFTLVDEGGES